jgi:transketolase
MRRAFAEILHAEMAAHPGVVLLTADLGYKMWDRIAADYPDRFYNVGAAEQAMVGMAVGLALAGRIPICYSITPFVLCRPFELVRLYLDHERVPVKLVGSGRGRDYAHDGFTHWADDDRAILHLFPAVQCYWPETAADLAAVVPGLLANDQPSYLNLRR